MHCSNQRFSRLLRLSAALLLGVVTLLALMAGLTSGAQASMSKGSPPEQSSSVEPDTRYDIVLVFDQSESVKDNFIRESVLRQVRRELERSCFGRCRLGVIVFGDVVSTVVPLSDPSSWSDDEITEVLEADVEFGTNFSATLDVAFSMLGGAGCGPGVDRRIVLVTDTDFDDSQDESAQRVAVDNLVGEIQLAGISLMVVDTNNFRDADSQLWRTYAHQTPGGRYFERARMGAEYDADILLDAMTARFVNRIEIAGEKDEEIAVAPYLDYLVVEYNISGTLTVTLEPPTNTNFHVPLPRVSPVSGGYIYSVTLPVSGVWSLRMEGDGSLFYNVETEQREFDLRREEFTRAVAQGAPLVVTFSIRDVNRDDALVGDFSVPFEGELVQEGTGVIRNLRVRPVAGEPGHYSVALVGADTSDFEGWFEVRVRDTLDLGISDVWRVFWGRIPDFATPPRATALDVRIEHPFTVTVDLENLERVESPNLFLRVYGPNEAQLQSIPMVCQPDAPTCMAVVEPLMTPNTYTLVALLRSGVTSDSIPYDRAEISSQVFVDQLTQQQWLRKHWKRLVVISVLSMVLLLFLVWVYLRVLYPLAHLVLGTLIQRDPQERLRKYIELLLKAMEGLQ